MLSEINENCSVSTNTDYIKLESLLGNQRLVAPNQKEKRDESE